MSLNQLEQDIVTIKNGRTQFTLLSVAVWIGFVVGLIADISTGSSVLLFLAGLTSLIMPIASHFALKRRRAELEYIT